MAEVVGEDLGVEAIIRPRVLGLDERGVREVGVVGGVRGGGAGGVAVEKVCDESVLVGVKGRIEGSFVCEGVCLEGVREVLRGSGGVGLGSVEKVLLRVFGAESARRAEEMASSEDVSNLSCKMPYSRRKGSVRGSKGGGETLKWKPLGKVGRIVVSDEIFEKCCAVKSVEELPVRPLPPLEEELSSYSFSEELERMFEWYVGQGFGRVSPRAPNTGVYVKVKPDGSKLQIISDRSAANHRDVWKPKSFRMFRADDLKKLLRGLKDVWFFAFDVSNFFHSFVVPKLMRERVPTIYRNVSCSGDISAIEADRLVFGSSFSPVVSHAAACDLLGVKDTVFSKKERDWRKELAEESWCEEDVSGMYADDLLEGSVDVERARERYLRKIECFVKVGCGIKESAVVEAVQALEFAGKSYCGRASCPKIGNTKKNKLKCVALFLAIVKIGFSRDLVESLVGSICFLGSHSGWCFPFLNRCSSFVGGLDCSAKELTADLLCALSVALCPWTPFSQFRWDHGCDNEKFVFVDAQNDFGRFGVVWFVEGAWRFVSCTIPAKFCGSQQCAELYGVKKAIGMALNRIGREFVLVSDSVGSLEVLCRMKMATKSWRRNQLLRSMVRDWMGKDFLIHLLWVPSEHNPADEGSRRSEKEGRFEGLFEGEMVRVFEEGVCLSRSQFYCRSGSGCAL
jgi:hypothetical protein